MGEELVLWGKEKKYALKDYEAEFMDMFSATHDLDGSYKALELNHRAAIKAKIRRGTSDLSKAFEEFITKAPAHPKANKVVILDTLVWAMEKSKKEEDTQGVIRAIQEINKMIKGNLVTSQENAISKTKLIGVIDLSQPKKEDEPVTIDVTHTEDG